jgi:hypothetical protein
VLVSGYHRGLAKLPTATPPAVTRAFADSLGSGLDAARTLPTDLATQINAHARQAFTDGFTRAALAGAVLAAIAVVVLLIPARADSIDTA